jgi:hypothetical protein
MRRPDFSLARGMPNATPIDGSALTGREQETDAIP